MINIMNFNINDIMSKLKGKKNIKSMSTSVEKSKKELRKFNKKLRESVENVKKIIVESTFVDVNILEYSDPEIQIHFYGQTDSNGNIKFITEVVNDELRICLRGLGTFNSKDLQLSIFLPKVTFEMISVDSFMGDIVLDESIFAKKIELKTMDGNVEVNSMFSELFVNTSDGNVELYLNTQEDAKINISTVEGEVLVRMLHTVSLDINTETKTGKISEISEIKNRKGDIKKKIPVLSGNIFTWTGDIDIYY